MLLRRHVFLMVMVLSALFCIPPAIAYGKADKAGEKKVPATQPAPKFTPGQVTRINNPNVGYQKHFLIYVPSNYTPDRKWPVIFSYHGQGGSPSVGAFKSLTEGKEFIIVGLPYIQKCVSVPGKKIISCAEYEKQLLVETRALADIFFPYVNKHLSVNKNLFFIGGTSRGGWVTSSISENIPSAWAGVIILIASRSRSLANNHPLQFTLKYPDKFRGKPIFIGVGEKESNRPHAEAAAKFYRKYGANVTLEIFEGLGHKVDTKNKALRDWLLYNGPLKGVKEKMARAKKAHRSRKLGKAYVLYKQLAGVSDSCKICLDAVQAAETIEKNAEQQIASARQHVEKKRYKEAFKTLREVISNHKGSELETRAGKYLKKLRTNPQIAAAIKQAELNAKAEKLWARGLKADKAKRYTTAVRIYETYLRRFPKAPQCKQVKARLKALKADTLIQYKIARARAKHDCRGWLGMADNYINAKMPKKAIPYLEKVIKKYGKTDWADEARKRLAKIKTR